MPAALNPGGAAKHSIPTDPPMEAGAVPKAAPRTMKTDIDKDRPLQPKDGDLIQKGAAVNMLKRAMLKKAQDGDTTSISTPKTSALPEDQPSQMARPAEVTSQEKMISSSEAAINYQKTQAKSVPKKRMGEVLQEKPQNVKQVLQPVLGDVVKEANQQRAAVGRALLAKIAHEGCSCDDSENGVCRFCKVAARLKRTQGMRKKSMGGAMGGSMGGGGNPIGPGGVPPTVQASSPSGGGSMGSGTPPM